MKKIILLTFITFFLSCEDKEDNYIEPLNSLIACGYNDPLNEIDWLNNLANKALTDNSGNYLGSIWIVNYDGTDYFITDMSLESGGIYHHYFDCGGNPISSNVPTPSELEDLIENSKMIFSTIN